MKKAKVEIVREYGPFPGVDATHGVSYNGKQVWFASGDKLNVLDPDSGKTLRSLDVTANAGTAFDGEHLFQIAGEHIQKIDPESGSILSTIPTPEGGASGLAWADGSLWVGRYRNRTISQVDPQAGKILNTIESNTFRDRSHLGPSLSLLLWATWPWWSGIFSCTGCMCMPRKAWCLAGSIPN